MLKKVLIIALLCAITFSSRQEWAPGIQLARGMYLHPMGNLVSMVISEAQKEALLRGEMDPPELTRRIYEVFQDSFDFIVFIHDDYEKPDSLYYGKCFPTQNRTQGLGKEIFDDSEKYGSSGRLKGIVHLTRNNAIREGPILHELMHIWGNDFFDTGIDGHWGYTGVGGQLGGFQRLVHLRDEFYKGFVPGQSGFSLRSNFGNAIPYAPLEKYLMGLIPAEDVPPIPVAVDAQGDPSVNGLFTASRIDTVCMEDLLALHGPRIPSWERTEEAFRGIVVLVSSAPVSRMLFDQVSMDAWQFSLPHPPDRNWRVRPTWWGKENFFTATDGLACLELGYLEELLLQSKETEDLSSR